MLVEQVINGGNAQIKGHDEYAARYVKFATANTKLPQPINVANTTLAYDAVTLLMGILRERKIDGSTNLQKARESIKDSLAAVKQWQGFNKLTLLESGDGYIPSHLLEVDVQNKMWKYSLPAAERLKK